MELLMDDAFVEGGVVVVWDIGVYGLRVMLAVARLDCWSSS